MRVFRNNLYSQRRVYAQPAERVSDEWVVTVTDAKKSNEKK